MYYFSHVGDDSLIDNAVDISTAMLLLLYRVIFGRGNICEKQDSASRINFRNFVALDDCTRHAPFAIEHSDGH